MARIRVVGAGPAGGAAALSALKAGAEVEIWEQSPFPRHKVCGEFLSPGCREALEELGAEGAIRDCGPAPMRFMELHFARRHTRSRLPDLAWGLSRSALDAVLLERARSQGAEVVQARSCVPEDVGVVWAAGRKPGSRRGSRIFGFKAHFVGTQTDSVELFFLDKHTYVGINPVEGGRTNVCGLAPEEALAASDFEIDVFLANFQQLSDRLKPLRRAWGWLRVGPLVFEQRWTGPAGANCYPAGDALSFVDPFTGSGILAALLTGARAGRAAAERRSVTDHMRQCHALLAPPFRFATLFRAAISTGWGQVLAPIIPGAWLFYATRPRLARLD